MSPKSEPQDRDMGPVVCRECRWYRDANGGHGPERWRHECHHPNRVQKGVYNPVTGQRDYYGENHGQCRDYNPTGHCREFEPKPLPPTFTGPPKPGSLWERWKRFWTAGTPEKLRVD